MSFVTTKAKFHCALNGVGMILQGAPDRIGYQQNQLPIYGNRFASGDRDYNDLSQWWYFTQSDWSGGAKDFPSWVDDAKFYYSVNIDAYTELGAIKLTNSLNLQNTFAENIICAHEGEANSETQKYVGTDDNASNRPLLYRKVGAGSWTDVTSTSIATTQNFVSQILSRLNYTWVLTVGAGSTTVVNYYDGNATWSDQSANLKAGVSGTDLSFTPASSRCMADINGVLYVAVDDSVNNWIAVSKATNDNPGAAGDWSVVFEKRSDGLIVAMAGFQGKLYYLLDFGIVDSKLELWEYDITNTTNTLIQTFRNTSLSNPYGVGDKLLNVSNGKLVVTVPPREIWEHDGTSLTRVWVRDANKNSIGTEAVGGLTYGGIAADNKVLWANLVYDNSANRFFHYIKPDSGGGSFYPFFVDETNNIYGIDSSNRKKLYLVDTTSYKTDVTKNYLVLSNHDKVAGIDKIAYSLTIIFKKLISGQSIKIEYLTDELTSSSSWTTLGTASYSVDGGSVTDKTFFFPVSTTFKRLWLRVAMGSGGSDTPTLYDVVMEYLPIPTYKKSWSLNINAADSIKRLDGNLDERTGRELRALLENAWWTKSLLDFQDLDYATTLVNDASFEAGDTTITVDNTVDFPEQGRLKIDDEEIFYTAKTPTSFTGCTRGARGTRAVAHNDDSVVNNAYRVIVTELHTRVPVTLKDKELEYAVGINLREA